MPIEKWIIRDPVSLDIVRRKHKIGFSKDTYQLLMSKIRTGHQDYYRELLGLNIRIEFKGFPGTVCASVPYTNDPVAFYKWWKKPENNSKVYMTKIEQIRLFIRVYEKEPQALLVKHKKMISN